MGSGPRPELPKDPGVQDDKSHDCGDAIAATLGGTLLQIKAFRHADFSIVFQTVKTGVLT